MKKKPVLRCITLAIFAVSAIGTQSSLAHAAGEGVAAPVTRERLDPLELEKNPGYTEPLASASVTPGPPVPGIAGKPGVSPASGPDDAAVKVYVFTDFQCPVCSRTVEPVKQVVRDHADVQVIFKNNALASHSAAAAAAAAALAAARQGKFWAYHDLLFANQRALSEPDLLAYAQQLALDLDRFQRDMNDPEIKAQVEYETGLAEEIGLSGTPGFVINGESSVGWGSYGSLENRVERALENARALQAEGVDAKSLAEQATLAAGEQGRTFARLMWGVAPADDGSP
ncbi:MAG: hypothetical protein E4H03_07785 [Myxococcales bacterium]|jgi:protein-disulfide isomerase|nr:MAG: hypothetical protein E4H03_07785 [Myxococcales bacterium]